MDSDAFTTFEAAGWNRVADEWWSGLIEGTVRTAAMVTDPLRVRAQFDRLAEPYRGRIPVSVVIATATR